MHSVNRETRWRVVEGIFRDVGRVLEHDRQIIRHDFEQVVANDDQGHAGRADVLLRAGINKTERAGVERPAHEVGGHIGDNRYAGRIREDLPLGAADGVVGSDVGVNGIPVEGDPPRDVGELTVLGGGHHLDRLV